MPKHGVVYHFLFLLLLPCRRFISYLTSQCGGSEICDEWLYMLRNDKYSVTGEEKLLNWGNRPHDDANALGPRQNGRHFPDDILKWMFLNENIQISITISQKFVPRGQWWLGYWRIYASLDLNEVITFAVLVFRINNLFPWGPMGNIYNSQELCTPRNQSATHSSTYFIEHNLRYNIRSLLV